jgi:hypothetical protein
MKTVTVIWFNRLKGFGEAFDQNGVIQFFTAFQIIPCSKVQRTDPNSIIKLRTRK